MEAVSIDDKLLSYPTSRASGGSGSVEDRSVLCFVATGQAPVKGSTHLSSLPTVCLAYGEQVYLATGREGNFQACQPRNTQQQTLEGS